MRKKLFAVIMSVMMMVTFMPAMAFAASHDHKTSADLLSNHFYLKEAGWNTDHSVLTVDVKCANASTGEECGKTVCSVNVDTERFFNDETGMIDAYAEDADVLSAVEDFLDDKYGEAAYTTTPTFTGKFVGENHYSTSSWYGNNVFAKSYYDLTGATIVNTTEMTTDEYLNWIFLSSDANKWSTESKFAAWRYIYDYSEDEWNWEYVGSPLGNKVKIVKPKDDTIKTYTDRKSYATRELSPLHPNDKYSPLVILDPAPKAEPGDDWVASFRVDLTPVKYEAYQDATTVNIPVEFTKMEDTAYAVNNAGKTTQPLKLVFNDDSTFEWLSWTCAADGDVVNYYDFDYSFDEEKDAKMGLLKNQYNYISRDYCGEEMAFTVVTEGVTVQYGTIDKAGKVTYADKAPEMKDVKFHERELAEEMDPWTNSDDDYSFIIKVSKAGITKYIPVRFEIDPADAFVGFIGTNFEVGLGETVKASDIMAAKVVVDAEDSAGNDKIKLVDVYSVDKANMDKYMNEYVEVNGLDTSKRGTFGINYILKKLDLDKLYSEDKEFARFVNNYNFDYLPNNGIHYGIFGSATLKVGDVYNQIRISNKTKTFHVKNAAKLKSTKTFQLKAKANYGKVTFKKVTSRYAKIKISKTGKVTVKKGLKKGTYKVKFKAYAPNKTVSRVMVIKIKK